MPADLHPKVPSAEALLVMLAKLFAPHLAPHLAKELAPLIDGRHEDDLVDRETAGVSKRWWDDRKGKSFDVFKDGRKFVARRRDVLAALAREKKFTPKIVPREPVDSDEAELTAAGIRFGGAR